MNLEDEGLTRYGIRNTGLEEPFGIVAALGQLPLTVDTSSLVMPKEGATIGVLTVSDSATNSVEQIFSVQRFYRGGSLKFTPVKLHDDDNGLATYAAKYEPTGLMLLVY